MCKGSFENVLAITDHFTRYVKAIRMKNMTAKATTEVFYNNFIIHYGLPQRIHNDQGANFESKLLREVCQLLNTKKSRTTPCPRMDNGMCVLTEHYVTQLVLVNQTRKKDQKRYIQTIVHVYNCTRHDYTSK